MTRSATRSLWLVSVSTSLLLHAALAVALANLVFTDFEISPRTRISVVPAPNGPADWNAPVAYAVLPSAAASAPTALTPPVQLSPPASTDDTALAVAETDAVVSEPAEQVAVPREVDAAASAGETTALAAVGDAPTAAAPAPDQQPLAVSSAVAVPAVLPELRPPGAATPLAAGRSADREAMPSATDLALPVRDAIANALPTPEAALAGAVAATATAAPDVGPAPAPQVDETLQSAALPALPETAPVSGADVAVAASVGNAQVTMGEVGAVASSGTPPSETLALGDVGQALSAADGRAAAEGQVGGTASSVVNTGEAAVAAGGPVAQPLQQVEIGAVLPSGDLAPVAAPPTGVVAELAPNAADAVAGSAQVVVPATTSATPGASVRMAALAPAWPEVEDDVSGRRFTAMMDYLASYDGGTCFALAPELGAGGNATLTAFALTDRPGEVLQSKLGTALGMAVPVDTGAVTPSQCSALDFIRTVPGYPSQALRIRLESARVATGSALVGAIMGDTDNQVHLLIIDDEGRVQSVDGYLGSRGESDAYPFTFPVFLTAGAVTTVQLLVAIGTPADLVTLAIMDGAPADAFFPALLREIGNRKLAVSFAVRAFGVD